MKYNIVRLSDGIVVEANVNEDVVDLVLFFYDTDENPHIKEKMENYLFE